MNPLESIARDIALSVFHQCKYMESTPGIDLIQSSLMKFAAAAREEAIRECAKIARSPYTDLVGADGSDEPSIIGVKISDGILSLLHEPKREVRE